ncbi:MAG: glycosyltransferase family 4 protein, partial [Candidatus Poseidoniaceae archaeon]
NNIVAHGWVSKEEKVKLLQESSLLLLPSTYEGQPMVALEALACGTPVLASNVLHSLPDGIKVASLEDIEEWIEKIDSAQGISQIKSFNSHKLASINENLEQLYSSKLSSSSASD